MENIFREQDESERKVLEVQLESEHLYRNAFDVDAVEELYRNLVMQTYAVGKLLEERIRHLPSHLLDFMDGHAQLDPVYPPCVITKHDVNGIPSYQLSYEGMLPLYFEKDPKIIRDKEKLKAWTKYNQTVRNYYIQATVAASKLRREAIPRFPKAFVYHLHFFTDLRVRDLDNRNRSVLFNALRAVQLIADDNWKNISSMEDGLENAKGRNHVEVFVCDNENRVEMVKYVDHLCHSGQLFRV